jgi:hypothetical protein
LSSFVNLSDIPEVYDIGVAEARQQPPLFAEHLDRDRVRGVAHGFEGHIAVSPDVQGTIHDTLFGRINDRYHTKQTQAVPSSNYRL